MKHFYNINLQQNLSLFFTVNFARALHGKKKNIASGYTG